MKEIKLLIFKRRSFEEGKITFYCKTKNIQATARISVFSENLKKLAEKVVETITDEFYREKFCFVFTKKGMQRIQTFENLKGPICTLEGLSEKEKEEFLKNLLTEKSRINAE